MTKIKFINKARKAAILPMLAVSMVALIGIIALAVDIGILAQTKSQLQSAADAAALSGSRGLTGDTSTDNNRAAVTGLALSTIQASTIMGQTLQSSQLATQVGYYNYDSVLGKFQAIFTGSKPATENWSAVKTDVLLVSQLLLQSSSITLLFLQPLQQRRCIAPETWPLF